MRGERSRFNAGYSHANATIAVLDLADAGQISLPDAERALLPCFALGVARGLGSETATLAALNRLSPTSAPSDALQAYNEGMIYGDWERRLGDTQPSA